MESGGEISSSNEKNGKISEIHRREGGHHEATTHDLPDFFVTIGFCPIFFPYSVVEAIGSVFPSPAFVCCSSLRRFCITSVTNILEDASQSLNVTMTRVSVRCLVPFSCFILPIASLVSSCHPSPHLPVFPGRDVVGSRRQRCCQAGYVVFFNIFALLTPSMLVYPKSHPLFVRVLTSFSSSVPPRLTCSQALALSTPPPWLVLARSTSSLLLFPIVCSLAIDNVVYAPYVLRFSRSVVLVLIPHILFFFLPFSSPPPSPIAPKKATNGISELFYRLFMRRSTTYVSLIMIGAIVGDDLYQNAVEDYWEKQNKGVRYPIFPPSKMNDFLIVQYYYSSPSRRLESLFFTCFPLSLSLSHSNPVQKLFKDIVGKFPEVPPNCE